MSNYRRYTAEEVADALRGSGGIISVAARRLGCTWHTVKRSIEKYKTVEEVYAAERERVLDKAEENLLQALNEREQWATKFVLTTIGKDRGYSERREVTGAKGEGVKVVFEWEQSDGNADIHAND